MLAFYLLLTILSFTSIASELQCAPCLWNGAQFSCGSIAWFTSHYHACCDGNWCTCTQGYPNGRCGCCGVLEEHRTIVNEAIISNTYYLTPDRRLYTQFVTLAKLNIDNQYGVGETIHSTTLKSTDLILWPGFEIDSTLSATENVVMEIGSYNVSDGYTNCCASIEIGFPPSCHIKFCCGTGCCC